MMVRPGMVLVTTAAVGGLVAGGVALARTTGSMAPALDVPSSSTPDSTAVAAARTEACAAFGAASRAATQARKPFLAATAGQWAWDDDGVVAALASAQSGMLTQVEWLRQHLPPATPAAVADPVREWIAASLDMIGADGQRRPAADANAAARRSNAARDKIEAACA